MGKDRRPIDQFFGMGRSQTADRVSHLAGRLGTKEEFDSEVLTGPPVDLESLPNQVQEVEHDWPLFLPAGWRCYQQPGEVAPGQAIYMKNGGVLVLCSCAIESDGRVWLHVSMSYGEAPRMVTYEEIQEVKRIFIGEDKMAYELHPPKSQHINHHKYVRHLWALKDGSSVTPDFTRNNRMI